MLDMLLGGMSQAGALGGALIGLKGQNDTNNMNQEMMRETNAFNSAEAAQARAFGYNVNKQNQEYATQMSNTAYQRSTADMRAAGINPMVAFSQGGASTPQGGSVPSGQASGASPARMESGLGRIGDALSRIGPDALSLLNAKKDLETKDAGVGLTKASALAATAQATLNKSNAKAVQAGMPTIENTAMASGSKADADMSENATRKAKAIQDREWMKYDKIENKVLNTIGGFGDALSVMKGGQALQNNSRDQIIKEESHLRNQGRLGTRVK